MAELVFFQTLELPALRIVGRAVSVSMRETSSPANPLPAFWDACFADGTFKALEALDGHVYNPDYVGWMGGWNSETGLFEYVVGMLMRAGCPIPEGLTGRDIGPCLAAVGWIRGAGTAEVCSAAHGLTEKALTDAGLSCRNAAWCMELYNCPRFTQPGPDGLITLDYYIPCT